MNPYYGMLNFTHHPGHVGFFFSGTKNMNSTYVVILFLIRNNLGPLKTFQQKTNTSQKPVHKRDQLVVRLLLQCLLLRTLGQHPPFRLAE